MRKFIVSAALFAVVFVGTSQGLNIAVSGTSQAGNQAIIDLLVQEFNATVTFGDYNNPANIPADTEVFIVGRVLFSGAYDNAANSATFNALTIPVVCFTSYVARPDGNRWGWHSGGAGTWHTLSGNETVVTAAGAKVFGVEGPVDWWNDASYGFSAPGIGTVGDGQILATSPAGEIVVASWKAGDRSGTNVVFGSDRLLFNVPDQGSGNPVALPNTAEGRQALITALKLILAPDTPDKPHEPAVLPANEDGSSGILLENNEDVAVIFSFKAAMDADQVFPVNPDIVGHYFYITNGTSDPNLYMVDYFAHGDMNDPDVLYGPVTLINAQGKTFKWKIEEALDDGEGNPLLPGDPNNIMGNDWTFSAVGANPQITSGPEHTLTDASGNATLQITTGIVANNFRWYKVVGQQDTAENQESDDIMLTDAGIYSGTTTKTLTITGAASDGSDDARYYAIAYNGNPETLGVPSVTSLTAWVWYPRLVNHYPFEETYDAEGVSVTPDIISGYDAMLLSNDTGDDIPVLAAGMPDLDGDFALNFDNPRGTDPNSADAQYAHISEGWAGAYLDITVSAWVYSGGGTNWNRILDYGNNNANYMFLCINPGSVNRSVRFAVNVSGTEQSVTSPAESLPNNEWTYVTATRTGTTARIYINGELASTNTNFTNTPLSYGPSVQNWLARSQWGANDGYFNGMLDDLKIYNYARTTEQVAKDYLAVRGDWVCNNELYNLPYDFNEDCIVNLADFAIFAETWLDSYRIYAD